MPRPLHDVAPVIALAALLLVNCAGQAGGPTDQGPDDGRVATDAPVAEVGSDGPLHDGGPSPDGAAPFAPLVSDRRVATDSVPVQTPCTWNAHLPKLVTDGAWSYAVFTRYTSDHAGRRSWIYRAQGAGAWTEGGRQLVAVHQPPGLALDTQGRLHLVFDCLAGFTCSTAGVSAGATTRFYDLIFYQHNADGSVYLGDAFLNYDEFAAESFGYMGVGVDPVGGDAYVSLATSGQSSSLSHFTQQLFATGAASPALLTVPKQSGAAANTLYPQLAFTPQGTLYLSVGELVPGWTSSAQYSHVVLYRRSGSQLLNVFVDSVSNPDGSTRRVFTSDLALSSTGLLQMLYFKLPADAQGNCNYLVREQAGGGFSTPLGVGCLGSYTQLQLDSQDNIYLLSTSGDRLKLLRSVDGGQSFTTHLIALTQLAAGTTSLQSPTLVKPWSSPQGYDPDVLYGLYSGADAAGLSWYAGSFTIRLAGP